jgi:ABC-type glycerol-3-phosphate transport system substrate-binding protein
MRNNVATLCARVGIAALASLGVFAVSGGAASAAPSQKITVVHSVSAAALTPAQCAALQQQIDTIEVRVTTLQELLETAPASTKGDIIKKILSLEAQGAALQAQYDAGCTA